MTEDEIKAITDPLIAVVAANNRAWTEKLNPGNGSHRGMEDLTQILANVPGAVDTLLLLSAQPRRDVIS